LRAETGCSCHSQTDPKRIYIRRDPPIKTDGIKPTPLDPDTDRNNP
jgi:hypothetical protein